MLYTHKTYYKISWEQSVSNHNCTIQKKAHKTNKEAPSRRLPPPGCQTWGRKGCSPAVRSPCSIGRPSAGLSGPSRGALGRWASAGTRPSRCDGKIGRERKAERGDRGRMMGKEEWVEKVRQFWCIFEVIYTYYFFFKRHICNRGYELYKTSQFQCIIHCIRNKYNSSTTTLCPVLSQKTTRTPTTRTGTPAA